MSELRGTVGLKKKMTWPLKVSHWKTESLGRNWLEWSVDADIENTLACFSLICPCIRLKFTDNKERLKAHLL